MRFDLWMKELTEVVSHERLILSRHDFFEKARDVLPLNKALRKGPASSDPHLYAEPVYSSTSTILAILVAEADSTGRGFRSTDRQVLKTISAMLASFLADVQATLGGFEAGLARLVRLPLVLFQEQFEAPGLVV